MLVSQRSPIQQLQGWPAIYQQVNSLQPLTHCTPDPSLMLGYYPFYQFNIISMPKYSLEGGSFHSRSHNTLISNLSLHSPLIPSVTILSTQPCHKIKDFISLHYNLVHIYPSVCVDHSYLYTQLMDLYFWTHRRHLFFHTCTQYFRYSTILMTLFLLILSLCIKTLVGVANSHGHQKALSVYSTCDQQELSVSKILSTLSDTYISRYGNF